MLKNHSLCQWQVNFDSCLKNIIKEKYTTWIAHYGVNPYKYVDEYDMLQYPSDGCVEGIGRVDANEMYRNLLKDVTDEDLSIPKKSNEEIADEVINGQWGNGRESGQTNGSWI